MPFELLDRMHMDTKNGGHISTEQLDKMYPATKDYTLIDLVIDYYVGKYVGKLVGKLLGQIERRLLTGSVEEVSAKLRTRVQLKS